MSVFWTLYWLGFLGIPLVIWFASILFGSGSGTSGTHIWVYQGTKNKVRDATEREVWEHNHPGKSWDDHQHTQFIGCSVVLVIGFLIFLVWLAAGNFDLPENRPWLRFFWQIGAPILGGLSAGAFAALQSVIKEYQSNFLATLHIIALILMGVGVIGALVLTFIRIDLPISYHWIWAPAGATAVLPIIGVIAGGVEKKQKVKKQERASEGGSNIVYWVAKMMTFTDQYDIKKLDEIMADVITRIRIGDLDYNLRNQEFFDLTETIILDMVSGKPMAIQVDEIYNAQESVIKAVQTSYFYSVDKFSSFDLHPRIEKALKK